MERHHGDLHVEALFKRGDLGLRAEHAERPGIEPHRHSRNLVGHSSLTKKGGRSRPFHLGGRPSHAFEQCAGNVAFGEGRRDGDDAFSLEFRTARDLQRRRHIGAG